MDGAPAYTSFSLTHVNYNPHDRVSYLCAWLAIVPQGLCVAYATLIYSTREIEIILMFAGQMACEAVNFILKRIIKEERPKQMHGKGYGMPSSHAQFVTFFSVHLALFLLLRHTPPKITKPSHTPLPFYQRLGLSIAALSKGLSGGRRPAAVWLGEVGREEGAVPYTPKRPKDKETVA
ncbi:hypothetical protein V490_08336 [Pseudogymnoascus sp. VKM F-3557]|nr:hypothetical protein V490_08336 [Pseudogymnoascus sp. VKM F-3557]